MKQDRIHIAFAGGGTGGHLFPGLAVAERLAAMIPRLRVTFCGGGNALERQAVAQAGFEYFTMPVRALPRRPREAVSFVIENLAGYMAARWFLREERVAAVVGLGGYASVPLARAAARRGLPLILLEQNVLPGRATRWLARRASLICTSFAETQAYLRCHCPVRMTGNPIRSGFACRRRLLSPIVEAHAESSATGVASYSLPDARADVRRQILVLGGSGGARALNQSVPLALHKVRSQLDGWQIVHQSGEAGLEATQSLYLKLALRAMVVPFLTDMPEILAATDLAICRSGGTTLAELAAAGVPAVLLPYPQATQDHQALNAAHLAAGGGCVTIDERKLSGRLSDELAEKLCFLLANDGLRRHMAAAQLKSARPQAAEDVAELIWSVLSSRSRRADMPTA
jgi:UDP-N-acetylglucosamine--N-acetylmuramyl-(pentapeptide) pyrophosphoryl-undecaprenol N-acetylglucosamine transferase